VGARWAWWGTRFGKRTDNTGRIIIFHQGVKKGKKREERGVGCQDIDKKKDQQSKKSTIGEKNKIRIGIFADTRTGDRKGREEGNII